MSWDLERLRKIAGLQESTENGSKHLLTEGWDDDGDDDEDPDVKKAEAEAKKRHIDMSAAERAARKVNVEKDLRALARSRKSKDTDEDEDEKEETAHKEHEAKESPEHEKAEHSGKKPSAADEKKETPADEKKEEAKAAEVEKKRRGRAPQEGSKSGQLRAWIQANPGKARKEAWAYAEKIGFTKAGFSTIYQGIKSRMKTECFILRHPSIPSFILHENAMMGQYQWISENDVNQEPLVFATKLEAEKVAGYLREFKNQLVDIERVSLDD